MASMLRRDDRGAQMQLDNDKKKFVQFGIIVSAAKNTREMDKKNNEHMLKTIYSPHKKLEIPEIGW
jgi:hypothetical protein